LEFQLDGSSLALDVGSDQELVDRTKWEVADASVCRCYACVWERGWEPTQKIAKLYICRINKTVQPLVKSNLVCLCDAHFEHVRYQSEFLQNCKDFVDDSSGGSVVEIGCSDPATLERLIGYLRQNFPNEDIWVMLPKEPGQ
jgi:hypothetical protein